MNMDLDEEVNLDDLIELSGLADEIDANNETSTTFQASEKKNAIMNAKIDGIALKYAEGENSPKLSLSSQTKQFFDAEGTSEKLCTNRNFGKVCDESNKDKKVTSDVPISRKSNENNMRILKDISIESLFNKTNESKTTSGKPVDVSKSEGRRDTDSSDDDDIDPEHKMHLTETGKMIKKRIAVKKSYEKPERLVIKTWKDKENSTALSTKAHGKESYMVEEFSGLRIINPLVSRDFLNERMMGRRVVKMSCIKSCMKNGDVEGDWVTIGVLVNKLPPKTSKNGMTYSIWKMCDRLDSETYNSVFFFGKAHTAHWKTAIGTVLGILNPSIVPDQDSSKFSGVSISIDHPGKVLMFGSSKDFGTCKGKVKNGGVCTAVIDKSKCEYCTYHISKEYKKFSLNRTEFQGFGRLNSKFGGQQPNFKTRVLKGENFMYGGQMFSTPSRSTPQTKSKVPKDKFILSNLNSLKRKADALDLEERNKKSNRIPELSEEDASKKSTESKFIDERLSNQTPGSRNLFQHLVNMEKVKKAESNAIVSVTPKELLKLHEQQLRKKQMEKSLRNDSSLTTQIQPRIGLGLKPGDEICLDLKPNLKKHLLSRSSELAKIKAIQKIKEKGPIQPKDPNSVKCKVSPEQQEKVKKSLEKSIEQVEANETPKKVVSSALGCIDISSEKMKKLLEKKSSHFHEIEMMDAENHEIYFNTLEKKEKMEEKMMATKEISCAVVSCRVCNYTAHHATDLCKNEQHPLKFHKAVKRFFACTDCKRRTYCFTKLPKKSCRGCGGSSFEKTGMMKPRAGPKLDSEILHIRGEERKFINS